MELRELILNLAKAQVKRPCQCCQHSTPILELEIYSGLCALCATQQTEAINDIVAAGPQGEKDDREED